MDAHHAHTDESILLRSECSGQWAVETASGSFYVLDLEARTQTRVPWDRGGRDHHDASRRMGRNAADDPARAARGPLCMWVDVVDGGIRLTWRRTNLVVGLRAFAGSATPGE